MTSCDYHARLQLPLPLPPYCRRRCRPEESRRTERSGGGNGPQANLLPADLRLLFGSAPDPNLSLTSELVISAASDA